MADYLSQFTGSEIDARLAKVPQLETGKQDKLVSGSNIKTVNGQSILGSGNIEVQAGDTDAVKYVAQTLTEEQKAQARANIDAASLADIADMDFVTAASLPTASASTMGHIYLIGPDANDNYDRYFTQEDGSSYSWVSLGSTQIDLSTYATKAEVTQLEAEVHNLSGKYYGLFTSSSLLPEGDDLGYAFVGSEAPFAIWNFDGDEWADTGATIDSVQGEPGVGFESAETPAIPDGTFIITLTNGDTITVDMNHNHPNYFDKLVGATIPSGGLVPDTAYKLGSLSGSVTIALASAVTGCLNHYYFTFSTPSTAPTITWPVSVTKWSGNCVTLNAPVISASKNYEVSILDGVGFIYES